VSKSLKHARVRFAMGLSVWPHLTTRGRAIAEAVDDDDDHDHVDGVRIRL
jgi:hypothetical protein